MKTDFPKAYSYLKNFEAELKKRTIKPFLNDKSKTPFYRLDNTGRYTFAPYKIVWKPIAGAITGKALSFASAVLQPTNNTIVIPDHSLMFVASQNLDEAYYLVAILNSSIARLVIASYSYEIGVYAHVTQYIRIPKFDPSDPVNLKISGLSLKAHQLASKYYDENNVTAYEELGMVEAEIDKLVAQVYGITDRELKEIKKCLAILEGEELEGEEEEVVELPPSMPDISLKDNVVDEGRPFSVDVVVSNPLEMPLTNVSIKLKLFDGCLVKKGFERVENEVSFPLSFKELKAGEYKVKAIFEYVFENVPKRVKKELTVYVKGSEVKHIERSFKPEDLFGA
jgi:hypothetical protein